MKALTLRHPWSWAIAYAGKDVENRDWSDDLARLNNAYRLPGERIAIHGGSAPERPRGKKHWRELATTNLWRQHCEDLEGLHRILGGELPDTAAQFLAGRCPDGALKPEHFICPGIVAVATVQRVTRTCQSRWAAQGALHIELTEVITLPRPVQCSGKQGLWDLGFDLEELVQERLLEWSVQQVPADTGRTAQEWLL